MKNRHKVSQAIRQRRARRIRSALTLSIDRPRLTVFRSLKHIRAQVIDMSGTVIASVSDTHVSAKKEKGVALAYAVGKLIAEKALAKKVKQVVFDKGRYTYHGRVKAVADGARDGGLVL